jgi:hypothetical protein
MRRGILIGTKNMELLNKPMEARDEVNRKMTEKLHLERPMIAGIYRTSQQNVVIVTNEGYTAQDLIDNTDVIRPMFECKRIQKDVQWFKTVVQGVPVGPFNVIGGMEVLKRDIELYNPELCLDASPKWILSVGARNTEIHGSVVISFDDYGRYRRSLRHRPWAGGVNCSTREFKDTRPTDRCAKCQRYGHADAIAQTHRGVYTALRIIQPECIYAVNARPEETVTMVHQLWRETQCREQDMYPMERGTHQKSTYSPMGNGRQALRGLERGLPRIEQPIPP